MERSVAKIGIEDCSECFDVIRAWGDKQPKMISSYIAYRKSVTNKERQRRIQWGRSKELEANRIISTLEKVREDLRTLQNAESLLHKINIDKYLASEKVTSLNQLLSELMKSVVAEFNNKIIENYSIQLTNFTLKEFRDRVAIKTNTAPKPDNTGFEEYVVNRLKLYAAVRKILTPFGMPVEKREHKEYKLMGSIGEKGKIFLEERHRLLNDEENEDRKSKYTEFNNNITDLKKIKDCLRNIDKYVFRADQHLFDKIDELRQLVGKVGVKTLDDFVGISKQTVNEQYQPYSLSNGERSILYIQRAINDDADVYLLDEPELSMANSYIDEVIRPRIVDLGRKNKIVIIATHNANLAVRTLPYTTMYRYHGASGYKTYTGNPFTNKLTNIDNPEDTLNWREISMKILEGGKEAFNDRKEIYG